MQLTTNELLKRADPIWLPLIATPPSGQWLRILHPHANRAMTQVLTSHDRMSNQNFRFGRGLLTARVSTSASGFSTNGGLDLPLSVSGHREWSLASSSGTSVRLDPGTLCWTYTCMTCSQDNLLLKGDFCRYVQCHNNTFGTVFNNTFKLSTYLGRLFISYEGGPLKKMEVVMWWRHMTHVCRTDELSYAYDACKVTASIRELTRCLIKNPPVFKKMISKITDIK